MDNLTDSTHLGPIILVENATIQIMGNASSIEKIQDSSIRTSMVSKGASGQSQRAQEQYKGTSHRNHGINRGKIWYLNNFIHREF
jgi:hypothetical protein